MTKRRKTRKGGITNYGTDRRKAGRVKVRDDVVASWFTPKPEPKPKRIVKQVVSGGLPTLGKGHR
jgi:hypothetical protein